MSDLNGHIAWMSIFSPAELFAPATPQRRDGRQPILEMQLGPVRFAVEAKGQAAARPFEHRLVVRETEFRFPDAEQDPAIQEIYRRLSLDEARNRLIVEDVLHAVRDGRSPIVLTERRDHLELLAAHLRAEVPRLIVLQGGMGAKDRKAVAAQLDAERTGEPSLLLATGDEVDSVFLVAPPAVPRARPSPPHPLGTQGREGRPPVLSGVGSF